MSSEHDDPLVKPANPSVAIDEEDDLFNFDELIPSTPTVAPAPAATSKHDDDAMEAVLGPAPVASKPAAAEPQRAKPQPAAPLPTPARPETQARPEAQATARSEPQPNVVATPTTVVTTSRSSGWLVGALALIGVSNLALVGLVWRSIDRSDARPAQVAPHVVEEYPRTDERVDREPSTTARLPSAFDVRPEGEETLETARTAIERGDHQRARELLHGLLAVADRLPDHVRLDVEARATFLIAESFRAQADALEAEQPPSEEHR